jgi:hypothetical protein
MCLEIALICLYTLEMWLGGVTVRRCNSMRTVHILVWVIKIGSKGVQCDVLHLD